MAGYAVLYAVFWILVCSEIIFVLLFRKLILVDASVIHIFGWSIWTINKPFILEWCAIYLFQTFWNSCEEKIDYLTDGCAIISWFCSIAIAICFSFQEVWVRFLGMGEEEDEWVNVLESVRQRSVPCEPTECAVVLPGDLILCFQVR